MSNIVFDDYFDGYDAWYSTRIGTFVDQVETDAAFSLLVPENGIRILDAGCGTGNFSIKLANMGCDVTGIDISENMLAQAVQKTQGRKNIRFYEMDASHMDFSDNIFDAALCMVAFEFIPDPEAAYREVKRVGKNRVGQSSSGTIQKGGDWAKLYTSEICSGTAYASADFKTKDEIIDLDRSCLADAQECLFVPPGLSEEAYTDEAESVGKSRMARQEGLYVVKFRKQGVISCQLSLYPLGLENYLSPIDDVLTLIRNSGLDFEIGEMSTRIIGPSAQVFSLIQCITVRMDETGCKYAMPLTISNVCGL